MLPRASSFVAEFRLQASDAVAKACATGVQNKRLLELYESYFKIIPAETTDQLRSAFRLRYEVYCVENAWENPAENPNGMETDVHDAWALHSILLHRPSQDIIGTVRLILPMSCPGMEGTGLPIRDVCHHELLTTNNAVLPWETTAEISRLAISKKMRRRAGDTKSIGAFTDSDDPRRRIPDTSIGLMQAMVAMSADAGATHVCAVVEPRLLRMLARLGIHFIPLGVPVTYHGLRQPCYSGIEELLARTWVERRDVWEVMTRDGTLWPLNEQLACTFEAKRSAETAAAVDA
jgi:N-acyl amino acid synthase of PEP-CTERM/exosortase system